MLKTAPENVEGRSKDVLFDDLEDKEWTVRNDIDRLVSMLRITNQLRCFEKELPEDLGDAFRLIETAESVAINAQAACGELSNALWASRDNFLNKDDLKVAALDTDLFWKMLQHAAEPEKDHGWIQKAEEIRDRLNELSGDCSSAIPYTEHWCNLVSRITKEVHIRDLWSQSRTKVSASGMVPGETGQGAQGAIP